MNEFKVFRNGDFTVMSNYHLKDKRLSLKAIGLLSKMLSLPENWDYSLKGLVSICKESSDTIRTTLNELKYYDYIEIQKLRKENGTFRYNYLIFENPYEKTLKLNIQPVVEKPYLDKLDVDNPDMENYNQYNINKSNIKISNMNNIDINDEKDKSNFENKDLKKHNILTLELIAAKYINSDEATLELYDNLFKDYIKENHNYKQLYSMVHYISNRVVKREFIDDEGNKIENKFSYFKKSMDSNFELFKKREQELYPENDNSLLWNDFEI